MKNKLKRATAIIASMAMCGSTLLNYPEGIFELRLSAFAVEGDIAIDEINFPDEIFRTYINDNFDTNDDDMLDAEEIAEVTKIDLYLANITDVSDLTGVEYFTALEYLDCYENQLKSLDVSKNTALTFLDCSFNPLTSLDVSKNAALEYLYCSSNQLTSLDVSGCTELTNLDCHENQFTSLDVSKNAALEYLYCSSNQLTSLDVSNNTALTTLSCDSNQITSLDVSKNAALEYLYCYENQLTSLDVSSCTALEYLSCESTPLWKLDLPENYSGDLDFDAEKTITVTSETLDLSAYELDSANFSGGTLDENGILTPDTIPGTATYTYALTNGETITVYATFGIAINEENFPDEIFRNYVNENFDDGDGILTAEEIAVATSISVSDKGIKDLTGVEYFTALTDLNCSNNQLTSLDVSKNTELTYLDCSVNSLTSLDVSKNIKLKILICNNNSLTSVDLSKNTALWYLYFSSNQLTSLDVSKNAALEYLYCSSNQLKNLDVSGCTALTYLDCSDNELTSLDVSKNTALTTLYCDSNQLWKLDLPENYSGTLRFDAEKTVTVTGETLDLSAYELDSANFSGGTLDENGILTPDTLPGTVTYTDTLANGEK